MAGSNSSTSINHQLVAYTVSCITDHKVSLHDLASHQVPIYNLDTEKGQGFPAVVESLFSELKSSDGWIFSVNEHNGNPSAYTKSLLDWFSRKERKFLEGMPVLLMSASPGKGGAASSQETVAQMLQKRFGAERIFRFSLPSFGHVFNLETGISDEQLAREHHNILDGFLQVI